MRFLFFLIVPILLYSLEFKVATYNVENLFDLKKDGSEYKEYIPNNTHEWNQKNYEIKLKNISKVIKDLNADILALTEIESKKVLLDLKKRLKLKGLDYPYYAIANSKKSSVKVALLSKYPITKTKEIKTGYRQNDRSILKATINIKNRDLILYINHWHSKRSPESRRLKYAKALKREIDRLDDNQDFIILGDFNCNYDEFKTFKNNKRLNDTDGKTGINHILNTIKDDKLVTKDFLKSSKNSKYLYNLWLELDKDDRFSHQFKRKKNTLDNIIIPYALFDDRAFLYKEGSFGVFKASYLIKNNKIYRWQVSKRGKGKHLGKGYSDHLPIYATFYIKE